MPVDDEPSLAWALAEAANLDLNTVERNNIHVAIAIGDTFAVIRHLIIAAADQRITLTADLVRRCVSWLNAYAGHEDEQHLRGLLQHVHAT
jgi:hypothetical protein